jgi:hypothetical protein
MPRVLPKTPPFKPEEMVVAWTTFAADDLPLPGVMRRGTKLRGDHPAVLGHPNYFCSADLPDDEMPNDFTYAEEPPQHEHEFVRILERLPDDQLMEATADVSYGLGGTVVRKGERLAKSDWRVRGGLDWFRPVIREEEDDGS